eukprot:Lithocolla_globosa_v1_NODE_611_length_3606_cov_79.596452.p1 type:complete len:659 gc:universal NODE_611_length_3606_cov_79.596452:249-2225(+)
MRLSSQVLRETKALAECSRLFFFVLYHYVPRCISKKIHVSGHFKVPTGMCSTVILDHEKKTCRKGRAKETAISEIFRGVLSSCQVTLIDLASYPPLGRAVLQMQGIDTMSKIKALEEKHAQKEEKNREIYEELAHNVVKQSTVGLRLSLHRATLLRNMFVYETNSEKKSRGVLKKYDNIPVDFLNKVNAAEFVQHIFSIIDPTTTESHDNRALHHVDNLHLVKAFKDFLAGREKEVSGPCYTEFKKLVNEAVGRDPNKSSLWEKGSSQANWRHAIITIAVQCQTENSDLKKCDFLKDNNFVCLITWFSVFLFYIYDNEEHPWVELCQHSIGILVIGYSIGELVGLKSKNKKSVYINDIHVNCWLDCQENGRVHHGGCDRNEGMMKMVKDALEFTDGHSTKQMLLTIMTRIAGKRSFDREYENSQSHQITNAIKKTWKKFVMNNHVIPFYLLRTKSGEFTESGSLLVNILTKTGFKENVWWKKLNNGSIEIFNHTGPTNIDDVDSIDISKNYWEGIKKRKEKAAEMEASDLENFESWNNDLDLWDETLAGRLERVPCPPEIAKALLQEWEKREWKASDFAREMMEKGYTWVPKIPHQVAKLKNWCNTKNRAKVEKKKKDDQNKKTEEEKKKEEEAIKKKELEELVAEQKQIIDDLKRKQ